MTAVLGASLGVSGIRTVSLDLSTDPPLSTESTVNTPESTDDPWGAVTWAVHRVARELEASGSVPVLALRDKNPTEAYGVEYSDGLALVTDVGAQIGALQEIGEIAGEQIVALFDVGAGGVTVSVVDRESGHIHASRRSPVLSGDGCDAALTDYLLREHGRRLEPDAPGITAETVCAAKEQLSTVTAVEVHGPFDTGSVMVHRELLDASIGDSVQGAVTLAASVIAEAPRVDALYAVGGGANMQIVRQTLLDALQVPVFAPREPEMLAARGAAGAARGFAAASEPPRAPGRPRHSDTSSGRITRLRAATTPPRASPVRRPGGL